MLCACWLAIIISGYQFKTRIKQYTTSRAQSEIEDLIEVSLEEWCIASIPVVWIPYAFFLAGKSTLQKLLHEMGVRYLNYKRYITSIAEQQHDHLIIPTASQNTHVLSSISMRFGVIPTMDTHVGGCRWLWGLQALHGRGTSTHYCSCGGCSLVDI